MDRLSLSKLLIAVNVGLILLAVVCVVAAAGQRLEQVADEQAIARVGLAAQTALQAVNRHGDEVLIASRLLAERPTLVRLVREKDAGSLKTFLEQFQRTGHLTGCAVTLGGSPFAFGGQPLPVEALDGKQGEGLDRFLILRRADGSLMLSASTPVVSVAEAVVFTGLLLDDAAAKEIARQISLPVRILDREAALGEYDDPAAVLRGRAFDAGVELSQRLEAAGAYVAVIPLRAPGGEIAGLVEARLPTTAIVASVRGLVRSLGLLSLGVVAVATLLSIVVARRLVRPLEALTQASARIGGGDLSTPIPRAHGAEIGTLASRMEEMRGRLLHLTAELRRRQAEAEAVLTGIAEGVFAVDRERRIRYMNPQAAKVVGVGGEEAIGQFCGDVLKPHGPSGTRPCEDACPIVHARFAGNARATEHLGPPGGARRTVVITSASAGSADDAASRDAAEDTWQFQVMRDETEVEATRRLRDVVIANVSHEFKTPLTAQLASIELLRELLPEPEAPEAGQLILSMERGTLRLTQLIDNLLESVRIEAGLHSIRRRGVALDEVVEEAVEMTAPLIEQRGQDLLVDLPYPLPQVMGDAPRLVQVFVNLLANANKFSPASSPINIGGAVGASEVTLWVEDQGPGLRTGTEASLFKRFVRTAGEDDDDEPEQGGIGLGLAIVKSIVDRHGGRVEVRSAEDRGGGHPASAGTRICVILPVAPQS